MIIIIKSSFFDELIEKKSSLANKKVKSLSEGAEMNIKKSSSNDDDGSLSKKKKISRGGSLFSNFEKMLNSIKYYDSYSEDDDSDYEDRYKDPGPKCNY
jgi:hypothetical protein